MRSQRFQREITVSDDDSGEFVIPQLDFFESNPWAQDMINGFLIGIGVIATIALVISIAAIITVTYGTALPPLGAMATALGTTAGATFGLTGTFGTSIGLTAIGASIVGSFTAVAMTLGKITRAASDFFSTLFSNKPKPNNHNVRKEPVKEQSKTKPINTKLDDYFFGFNKEDITILLTKAKLDFDDETVSSLLNHENGFTLFQIAIELFKGKSLNNARLAHLLEQNDLRYLHRKDTAMASLNSIGMLNDKTIAFVFAAKDSYFFDEILTSLSKNSLLEDNEALITGLMNETIDHHHFWKGINYLDKKNLLNQRSFYLCSIVIQEQKDSLFDKDIFDLFELCDRANLKIPAENLETLFCLRLSNVKRLFIMMNNLENNHLLNPDSFKKALEKVAVNLPKFQESTAKKESRKKTLSKRSVIILDNSHQIFTDHSRNYDGGGFGKVKKGYDSEDSVQPQYSLKKLHGMANQANEEEAKREVKFNRLLRRNAYYYTHKERLFVTSDWQHGVQLGNYSAGNNQAALMQIPIEKRLKCLRAGLSDLDTLHTKFRVHGDIKPSNFVIDLANSSMHLIDFGTSRKQGSKKSFALTLDFIDPINSSNHFAKDIYLMTFVVATLFPEWFEKDLTKKIKTPKSSLPSSTQAIINLFDSMSHKEIGKRCTANSALRYCDELIKILENKDEISDEVLNSIHDSEVTVEDALRGRMRH